MQSLLLYGGGLDSTALLLQLLQDYPNLKVLHFNYGQKAFLAERQAALYWCNKYDLELIPMTTDLSFSQATIMKGTSVGNRETNRLELRNLVLIAQAASFAASTFNSSILYLGFHKEPYNSGFLDAKQNYLPYLRDTLDKATDRPVCLSTPFRDMTRQEILELGIKLDKEILTHSHTCYEPQTCGVCVHCIERANMIKRIGALNE